MSTIENFINKLNLTDKTKANYKSCLQKFEKDTKKTIFELLCKESNFYKYISNLPNLSEKTKENRKFIVLKFIKTMNLKNTYFKKKLEKKSDKNSTIKKNQIITDENLDDIKDYFKEIRNTIENNNHKLLLSLLINYQAILRTDLANVKLKNFNDTVPHYKDGHIIFPKGSCNKVSNKTVITIELSQDDILLLNFDKEYLLDINYKNRNNGYSSLVAKLSKQYLGKNFTQNHYRHLHSTHHLHFIDSNFIEKFNYLSEIARTQNHQLDTMLSYYVDNKK